MRREDCTRRAGASLTPTGRRAGCAACPRAWSALPVIGQASAGSSCGPRHEKPRPPSPVHPVIHPPAPPGPRGARRASGGCFLPVPSRKRAHGGLAGLVVGPLAAVIRARPEHPRAWSRQENHPCAVFWRICMASHVVLRVPANQAVAVFSTSSWIAFRRTEARKVPAARCSQPGTDGSKSSARTRK